MGQCAATRQRVVTSEAPTRLAARPPRRLRPFSIFFPPSLKFSFFVLLFLSLFILFVLRNPFISQFFFFDFIFSLYLFFFTSLCIQSFFFPLSLALPLFNPLLFSLHSIFIERHRSIHASIFSYVSF